MKKCRLFIFLLIVICTGLTACGTGVIGSTNRWPPNTTPFRQRQVPGYRCGRAWKHGRRMGGSIDFKGEFLPEGIGMDSAANLSAVSQPAGRTCRLPPTPRATPSWSGSSKEALRTTTTNTEAVRYTATTGWEAPVNAGNFGIRKKHSPQRLRRGLDCYRTADGRHSQRVGAARYVPGTGWRAPEIVDTNAAAMGDPQVDSRWHGHRDGRVDGGA